MVYSHLDGYNKRRISELLYASYAQGIVLLSEFLVQRFYTQILTELVNARVDWFLDELLQKWRREQAKEYQFRLCGVR